MKILNVIFAIAVGTMFLLLAYQADVPDSAHDPNPMKHNLDQFTRMQVTYEKESEK
ncbi:hypothetical protein [Paenibacillus plantarum]|uniref:hypothetical protein n=1 Tax=Paenibacillus plantarum TaxID=2654975 RepID=UPI00149127C7|nr:hypothetical protein [Paenibacillus plantarum]